MAETEKSLPGKESKKDMQHGLADKIRNSVLSRFYPGLEKFIEPAIILQSQPVNPGESVPAHVSKFAGIPHLPPDFQWPEWKGEPLTFLAQIDLAEASKYDVKKLLPTSGMLYFFYEVKQMPWGFDPHDRGSWRVIYYNGDPGTLRPVPPPENIQQDTWISECLLGFSGIQTFFDGDVDYAAMGMNSDEEDLMYGLIEEEIEEGKRSWLLGHPYTIQGDMRLESQLAFHGVYVGGPSDIEQAKVMDLREGASDWQLLLQIDSDENAEMMWGDMGALYFWIRKQDLAAANFENVWMILQCY